MLVIFHNRNLTQEVSALDPYTPENSYDKMLLESLELGRPALAIASSDLEAVATTSVDSLNSAVVLTQHTEWRWMRNPDVSPVDLQKNYRSTRVGDVVAIMQHGEPTRYFVVTGKDFQQILLPQVWSLEVKVAPDPLEMGYVARLLINGVAHRSESAIADEAEAWQLAYRWLDLYRQDERLAIAA